MDNITIICAVAVEFKGPGGMRYEVTREKRNLVLQAPAWIKDTLTFRMLAADGSLKYVTPANRIQVENDPLLGLNAEGKEIKEGGKAAEAASDAIAGQSTDNPLVDAEVPTEAEEPKAEASSQQKKTGGRRKKDDA